MKRNTTILILFLLLFSLGCKSKKTVEESAKPLIITTIHPYELLIKQLVGDGIEVKSLVPPNASPHNWSAKPADLKDLHKADLIISNGMGLESFIAQALQNTSAKHLVAADLLQDLVALDSLQQVREHMITHQDSLEDHHHDHEGQADPHLWTSPLMLQKLCTKLKSELILIFPDSTPVIMHNHDIIQKELADVQQKILADRAQLENPALVTYHNSFHYFTRDFDIHYLGWVQSSPGKEPSAKDLNELGKKIREHKVKSIFIEPQQNPKSAEVLAREYGLELATLDPLGSSMPVKTVAELIDANWQVMKMGF
ncbi:MAG: metal ABC transporter substrate-binding protein [Candidatus Cloacimonetes bacterium]|jgi:zinc transport system substrate-binding protein|nr:metal ABC transporter substrate-binding protein [Candidatus Cloacimonadota bacterium]MDD2684351.1 metal ABC transporter substrate-binding protein [Candidatus Cloacimonadota bacterium]MDD4667337.1 metal ABC transporter substrate-binding protein [Candidatus Cloacimonadota bacterium]MDY0337963.1 metal ABC transporter substrate-binding protein [Candidatus Cloacimonadaceae bacterium]